jgi:hypothetical protein
MREQLKRAVRYMGRGWDSEPRPPHPLLKLLPPFVWEVFSFAVGLGLLYQIALYLLTP